MRTRSSTEQRSTRSSAVSAPVGASLRTAVMPGARGRRKRAIHVRTTRSASAAADGFRTVASPTTDTAAKAILSLAAAAKQEEPCSSKSGLLHALSSAAEVKSASNSPVVQAVMPRRPPSARTGKSAAKHGKTGGAAAAVGADKENCVNASSRESPAASPVPSSSTASSLRQSSTAAPAVVRAMPRDRAVRAGALPPRRPASTAKQVIRAAALIAKVDPAFRQRVQLRLVRHDRIQRPHPAVRNVLEYIF